MHRKEWPRYQCLFPAPILGMSSTHIVPGAETPAGCKSDSNMSTHLCIPISGYCHPLADWPITFCSGYIHSKVTSQHPLPSKVPLAGTPSKTLNLAPGTGSH